MCDATSCIDAATVAAVIGSLMTAWILGFGLGKAVAWMRRIASVA